MYYNVSCHKNFLPMRSDPVWSFFNQLGHVSGFIQKRSECKKCGVQINASTRQARSHLEKCNTIINNDDQQYSNELQSIPSSSTAISILPFKRPIYKRTTIQSFVDQMSENEQKSLEMNFARSVFQCGLFLSLSEMEPIQNLWKQARPAFKLPNRKRLSTTLLDAVYKETEDQVQLLLDKSENLCLISDGWYVFFI
jgi:hypothetical protein